ncbi:putative methyltransferase ydaC [Scleropages formosus]|nr:putative methyltransferase ydaC [Scleropages formosus]
MLSSRVGQQLGCPTKSLMGWLASKFFKWHNEILEENAAKLCGIRPDDAVLEVGYGPGLGLLVAAPLLSGPKGKLIGVDCSEYMYKMASEKVKDLIMSGKVTLHLGRVEAMPFDDSSMDKVYHCNCYYFWSDLKAGASELHRVMKPGGLMVTTLQVKSVAFAASKGFLKGDSWRPEMYMEALRAAGFTNVKMESRVDKGITFQAIFGTSSK